MAKKQKKQKNTNAPSPPPAPPTSGRGARLAEPQARLVAAGGPVANVLALIVRPDPSVWDGQFASNPWLQELPRPLTKIAWQNAVQVSPALAAQRKLENGDLVRVSAGGRSAEGPVWIMSGQERNTILLHLGYGRRKGGA